MRRSGIIRRFGGFEIATGYFIGLPAGKPAIQQAGSLRYLCFMTFLLLGPIDFQDWGDFREFRDEKERLNVMLLLIASADRCGVTVVRLLIRV